ncbi:hypothetical protein HRbin40_00566 [bacterium HR40]|nr:hypothetical protein HRbin40_00566 [bacterium HR40]
MLPILGLLAGCELRPLYGGPAGSELAEKLAAIEVEVPHSRAGLALAEALRREFGASGLATEPRYLLKVQLERQRKALLVQLDDSITRYELLLTAKYDLVDRVADRVLLRSVIRQASSFNVVRQPFADFMAERDAEARATAELARALRTRLALFLAGHPS